MGKRCQVCDGPIVNGRCKYCGMPYRNDAVMYHLNEDRSEHYRHSSAKVNILFFLTPKSDVAYIFENETLRQTLEKMEHRKFSCIPLLSLDGKYRGTISEGDLLWGMKTLNVPDIKAAEGISIMAIPRRATYKAVHADSNMEDLLDKAINQNYVPVTDDQGYFIGIITRKEIIKYCYKELKKYESSNKPETE
jgi:CBS domain-containing protein